MTGNPHPYRLHLLGSTTLAGRRQQVDLPGSEKARALLAYLACEPVWHSRDRIAAMLWPDAPAPRANLRQALLGLRASETALPQSPPLLLTRRDALRFNHPQWDVDALELAAELPPGSEASLLERRLTLYGGDFLPGPAPADCPAYQEWLELQRESLRLRLLTLADQWLEHGSSSGQPAHLLLPLAQRCASIDPWRETSQRRLMALYMADGQVVAACRQYETFARQLQDELGIPPEVETQRLYAQIQTRQAPAALPPAASSALPGRRLLTVLSCEISAPDISADTDPEQWQARLAAPQQAAAELAKKYGGHVRQACDGELLVYFGYPQAQENAARQALRAALAIEQHLLREPTPALSCQMGIHSGVVVTTSDGMLQGPTPRQAIRLRARTEHGIVISAATASLTRGYFQLAPLDHSLPTDGLAPSAYRLQGESGATHRLEAAGELTPLHGRDAELASLHAAWRRVADTPQQHPCEVLLIEGEAGVGKSRLLLTFKEALSSERPLLRELYCDAESRETPYHPIIATLRGIFGFAPGDDDTRKRERLQDYLRQYHPQAPADTVPVLTQLLGLPAAPGNAPLAPAVFRPRLHKLLPWLLAERTRQRPVLMLIDDAHWLDDSSRELLACCVAHEPAPNLLLLLASRPLPTGESGPLPSQRLPLKGLPQETMSALVHSLAPYLGDEALQRIVSRAEGIPFFAEEMVRLADSGDTVPASLHDLFAVRFDRSGSACHSAQLAACIGRRFSRELLYRSAPSDYPQRQIDDDLQTLQALHLLRTEEDSDELEFHHALLQEAAYGMQTEQQRTRRHAAIAAALQAHFPALAAQQPELVARHLGAATEFGPAIAWWLRAGQQAASQFAHREAQTHLQNGLDLLPRLNTSEQQRAELESRLLIHLARSEQCLVGYSRGRTMELLAQAIHLQQATASDSGALFDALWGMLEAAPSYSGYAQALQIAEQLMTLARSETEPQHQRRLLIQAHYALGGTYFWQGNYRAAEPHLREILALEDKHHPERWVSSIYGRTLLIAAHSYLALLLDATGRTLNAAAMSPETLQLAERTGDPMMIAFAGSLVAALYRRQGRIDDVEQLAQQHLASARAANSLVFAPFFAMLLQWAQGMRGNPAPLADSQRILAGIQAAMPNARPSFLLLLAEIQHHHGDNTAALATVDDALAIAEQCGQGYHNGELLCLRAHCQLALGQRPVALKTFRTALTLSRQQHALTAALSAATALAQLLTGKAGREMQEVAREILAECEDV